MFKEIEKLLDNNRFDYYLGFGGVGDALITLASAWGNPKAHIIFFGYNGVLVEEFFRTFGIPAHVLPHILGNPLAPDRRAFQTLESLKKVITIQPSGHMPENLRYQEWFENEDKYVARIVNSIPEWRDKFGRIDKKLVVIAPTGSTRDVARQRFITLHEFQTLVIRYLAKGYEVYGIGSEADGKNYAMPGVWWATHDSLRHWRGGVTQHKLCDLLKIINSAEEVVSMDTWLKTYSLLVGVPTTVIATRWHGKYKPWGEDFNDWIFINKKIWPNLTVSRIEDMLNAKPI